MPRYKHILLVDDEGVFREGAALQLLSIDTDIQVSQAKSPDTAREAIEVQRPDLIFLDLDFADERFAGLKFLKWLKVSDQYGDIPVIVMSGHRLERGQVEDLLEQGAAGYVSKSVEGGAAMFKAALMTMEVGGVFVHGAQPAGTNRLAVTQRLGVSGNLRPSHLRVLARHVKGMPYKTISHQCGISEQVVREYISDMCRFFKVKNSKALIYEIARAGVAFEEDVPD
jgi:DNA-binding NarL/FixJ family response regulator